MPKTPDPQPAPTPLLMVNSTVKRIRAAIIADYLRGSHYTGVVCFGTGHAAEPLRECGLDVLAVQPSGGDLQSDYTWTIEGISTIWPLRFDATSGHLPWPLVQRIADALRAEIYQLPQPEYVVPCGSGETVVALAVAYPATRLIAAFNMPDAPDATKYDAAAPLLPLVRRLCVAVTGVAD